MTGNRPYAECRIMPGGCGGGCLAAAGPFCRPCNGAGLLAPGVGFMAGGVSVGGWVWREWRECFRWRLGLARTAGAEGAAHVADRSVLSLRGATFWALGVWWWVCLSLQILQGRGLTRTYPWK